MKWLLARLNEGSTWRGVVLVAMAFLIHTHPDRIEDILKAGLAFAGLFGVATPDKMIPPSTTGVHPRTYLTDTPEETKP